MCVCIERDIVSHTGIDLYILYICIFIPNTLSLCKKFSFLAELSLPMFTHISNTHMQLCTYIYTYAHVYISLYMYIGTYLLYISFQYFCQIPFP